MNSSVLLSTRASLLSVSEQHAVTMATSSKSHQRTGEQAWAKIGKVVRGMWQNMIWESDEIDNRERYRPPLS